MGINPTPTNFKTFTFDGENSRNYGVYITGEGVFNAPERNVEMVDIPGRNGAFALDKGNFNNIEVTYPAGIFADTEADFAQAVSDLRNLLCSKVGYVRLEDDYNPNEYRLAIYKSGLDVEHDFLIAGEFELVFECKPQRYLKSGETAISVTSGDTITNPTRFASHPMLEVTGYGTIEVGGAEIEVANAPIGNVLILPITALKNYGLAQSLYPEFGSLNTGDPFAVTASVEVKVFSSQYMASNQQIISSTNCENPYIRPDPGIWIDFLFDVSTLSCVKGTDASVTATITPSYIINGTTYTPTFSITISYDQANEKLIVSTITKTGSLGPSTTVRNWAVTVHEVFGNSTRQATGNPMYIDLDIGEAWNEDSGTPVSVNNAVQLPSELPTLASGANTITYGNTVTQLDIVPRWWQV